LLFCAVTCITLEVSFAQKQTDEGNGDKYFETIGHVNSTNPFQKNIPYNKSEYCNLPDQIDFEESTLINKSKVYFIFTQIISVEAIAVGQFVSSRNGYRTNTVIHTPLFKVFRM